MTDAGHFSSCMERGAALHAAGQPEQALMAFEKALALQPADTNAASACATLLTALGQPQAAYQVLQTVREQLLGYADGATNLAISAETCGQMDAARAAYARALALDPDHVRALNNTALLSAREGDWPTAISKLERCIHLVAHDATAWLNLADTLTAARRFADAVRLLGDARQRFPQQPAFAVRHAIVLAFDGQIETAQQAMDAMEPPMRELLCGLVAGASTAETRMVRKRPVKLPDAYDLFCQQAFDAMQACDWRDYDRLTALVREMLARAVRTGQGRDGRDTQFYGLVLPLQEDEMAQIRRFSVDVIGKQLTTPMAPFVASRSRHRDPRIHVGLATQSLRDPRINNALQQQLLLHDQTKFALHVYSPTPEPDFQLTERLVQLGAQAVEIAHMTDDEAVARMRLDELDVFVDMAFDTPWCRPEIPERRVAPVQIRQTTWHRHHPPRPCDYNMSDTFIHPPGLEMEKYGAIVRLPHTCWLATNNDLPDPPALARKDAGLPEGALVLCALLPALMVDPQSFGLWMKMLQALPHAVLWLPSYSPAARRNLAQAARPSGVDPARIICMPPCARPQMLALVGLADLFVDAVRVNANHGLVDALRMGVPALTCAGQSMASRLGGSILRAAGLADCIVDSPAGLVEAAVTLGRDPHALQALRTRLAQQHAQAPLFDPRARVREWEAAWTAMLQRHQAGLPPQAFDVPPDAALSANTAARA